MTTVLQRVGVRTRGALLRVGGRRLGLPVVDEGSATAAPLAHNGEVSIAARAMRVKVCEETD